MNHVATLNASLSGLYEVDREIGRGGMATVYLARDARHERKVALKVLNPELGAVLGGERFLAEIKVTANLQHPNLLPLFDSGEAGGHLFYVMPFVEGETLRARLDREKQLPVDEALRIVTAIAGALDYAHRHGVIHRDLKPENILLLEGQPLIADFGIALAVSNAGGSRVTQTGLSLGTPQYMSPEQATGDRAIDGRTDIYSLGAMLYEMLAGDPPHLGGTSQAVIAKVLTEKPRGVRLSRPNVAPHIEAAVERALEKLPADRFASAQEFSDAISGKFSATASTGALTRPALAPVAARPWRFGWRDAVYGIAIVAALVSAGIQRQRANNRVPAQVLRVQMLLPKDHRLNDVNNGTSVAVSPSGDKIAYIATTATSSLPSLVIRGIDQLETRSLVLVAGALRTPIFSPDGRSIAYTDGSDIKKVSVEGGPVATLGSIADVPLGIAWASNGDIVVGSASTGLYVISDRGGTSRLIPKAPTDGANRWPVILPDGKTILYLITTTSANSGRLALRSLDGGPPTVTEVIGAMPVAYLSDQLIYVAPGGVLMAVPFDLKRLATKGAPVPLVQDVLTDGSGGAKIAISPSGMLVYRSGKPETQVVAVHGAAITPMSLEPRDFSTPRYSPDGKRIAFTVASPQSTDVWVLGLSQGTLVRVTSVGNNSRPEWTPDGKRVIFISDRGGSPGIWAQSADASTAAELLLKPAEGDPFEAMMSSDGKWLVYRTGPAGKPPRSIFAVPADGKGKSILLVSGAAYIQMPRLSPDGRWLAYQSNESGQFEVFARPFPDAGGRVQVSIAGGTEPLWAPSGRWLSYRTSNGVITTVSVTTGTSFTIGERKVAFTGAFLTNPSHPNYDILPDGSGFLLIRRAGDDVQTIIVQNWVKELIAKTAR